MSGSNSRVSPQKRTWAGLDDVRVKEAKALGEALRRRHPLGTSKLVVAQVAVATGFEIKFDTVQSWLADGRTPSVEALAALDATYGADFILERRKPFIDQANLLQVELKRHAVKAAEHSLSEAEADLAQAQGLLD
jgi:hypothetical protein